MTTFKEAWKKKEAAGYQYGADALEQVRHGWEMAHEEMDEVFVIIGRSGEYDSKREWLVRAFASRAEAFATAVTFNQWLADRHMHQDQRGRGDRNGGYSFERPHFDPGIEHDAMTGVKYVACAGIPFGPPRVAKKEEAPKTTRVEITHEIGKAFVFDVTCSNFGPGSRYRDRNIRVLDQLAKRIVGLSGRPFILDLTREQMVVILEEFSLEGLQRNSRHPRDEVLLRDFAAIVRFVMTGDSEPKKVTP